MVSSTSNWKVVGVWERRNLSDFKLSLSYKRQQKKSIRVIASEYIRKKYE